MRVANSKVDESKRVCRWAWLLPLVLAAVLPSVVRAEKANVFFIHGANVNLEEERAWAAEMFKRLWQAGAQMNFLPVSWESDIGPSWNYHANVSNAFETARRLAVGINAEPGRNVVIAHSLGTMVAAAAIQDYGARVDKLIMLNSAIPSEAFDPDLFKPDPQNHLVHDDWMDYTNVCWTALWHERFPANDARSKLTWRGRFAAVVPVAVNFYSSGDEVLELYMKKHNPSFYNGVGPSGNWGDRYAWHKQEIWKGRYSTLGFMGTTDLNDFGVISFDMNAAPFKPTNWPRSAARPESDDLGDNWLHSDIKDVAYFYTHKVFEKIVEVGGLR